MTTTTLPDATQTQAYNPPALQATGGIGPYTWSAGTLPAGLALSTSGQFSGIATATGPNTVVITVKDSATPQQQTQVSLSLKVDPLTPLAITVSSLPGGTVGAQYSQQLAATGGTIPYAWSLTAGTLPPGLTLSKAGLISGTPSSPAATASGLVFTVTDGGSPTSQTKSTASLSIAIAPQTAASISVSSGSPQSAVINTAFASLQALVKDSLGNAISGATVVFTAPTAAGASGTFAGGVSTFTTTTNASGVAAAAFTANSTKSASGSAYNVTASVSPVSTAATFALTNLQGTPATMTASGGALRRALPSIRHFLPAASHGVRCRQQPGDRSGGDIPSSHYGSDWLVRGRSSHSHNERIRRCDLGDVYGERYQRALQGHGKFGCSECQLRTDEHPWADLTRQSGTGCTGRTGEFSGKRGNPGACRRNFRHIDK